MADMPQNTTGTGSSGTGLAFIVGALVAVVAIIGYFVLVDPDTGGDDVTIRIDTPSAVEDAADAVGDAAQGAADAVEDAVEN